ncbi:hypothetical protein [Microbacterium sp. Se63.02b]|uniref:hypothetical protein n=1 Tax=Microbacterium sp. Se63.02b TaxID=2709304 RepID=UPI001FCE9425|nr:hypothetical protein [Microbacterium sp. Se63.02b]
MTLSGSTLETATELAVIDARRRSTLAVDSAGSYVANALADGGLRVRLDVASASVAEQDRVVDEVAAASGTTVVLIDRPDTDAAQRPWSSGQPPAIREPWWSTSVSRRGRPCRCRRSRSPQPVGSVRRRRVTHSWGASPCSRG